MPHYLFNIRHRPGPAGLAVDPEGDNLPDLNAARAHALFEARAVIAQERLPLIHDWMDCSFEIMSEAGETVLTVPFSDTVLEGDSD